MGLELELNKIYSQYGFDIIFDNVTVLFQYIFYAEVPRAKIQRCKAAREETGGHKSFFSSDERWQSSPFKRDFGSVNGKMINSYRYDAMMNAKGS